MENRIAGKERPVYLLRKQIVSNTTSVLQNQILDEGEKSQLWYFNGFNRPFKNFKGLKRSVHVHYILIIVLLVTIILFHILYIKIAIETLNIGRIAIGAKMIGFAVGAMDITWPILQERKQFGLPIYEFQRFRHNFSKMRAEILALESLLDRCVYSY